MAADTRLDQTYVRAWKRENPRKLFGGITAYLYIEKISGKNPKRHHYYSEAMSDDDLLWLVRRARVPAFLLGDSVFRGEKKESRLESIFRRHPEEAAFFWAFVRSKERSRARSDIELAKRIIRQYLLEEIRKLDRQLSSTPPPFQVKDVMKWAEEYRSTDPQLPRPFPVVPSLSTFKNAIREFRHSSKKNTP
jgi:hypothetical protein